MVEFTNLQEQNDYLDSLKVFWEYKGGQHFSTYPDMKGKKRIVNQNEIIEFIRLNPGYSESEIFEEVYNFTRGGIFSNKKYADCLRRAMRSRKIWRVKGKYKNESGRKLYRYYFMPEILK
jgi:hypothetical protein